jgi:MOSC domain-containing protein YiiM
VAAVHRDGLLKEVVGRAPDGSVVRRAGVMAVVVVGGTVHRDDPIVVDLPTGNPVALAPA